MTLPTNQSGIHHRLFPILLILLVGLALYLPSLRNHFVWDDEEQVVANVAVHSLKNIPSLFTGSTFNSGGAEQLGGLYYKPLMSVCFAVLYTLFGPSPWAFHLFQILLHLASTILIYLIFQYFLKKKPLSLLLSLIFLVHPLNVETVVYISSLQDTLAIFFGLAALMFVLSPGPSVPNLAQASVRNFMIFCCLLLALLGKETGVLFLPLVVFATLLFHKKQKIWPIILTTSLVFILYLYLRLGIAHVGLHKNLFTPIATLPLLARLQNIPAIITYYLSNFFWPNHLAISQHWIVVGSPWAWLQLAGLITIWLSLLVWALKKQKTVLCFFWLWFGLGLVFHSQIFPLDLTVADRWFYFPMIGLLGSLGALIPQFRSSKQIGTFATLVLLILFIRSTIRIHNWQDGLTLYSHDVGISPNSFDLQNNLGVELFRANEVNQAKTHFLRSTQLAPTWWTNWSNLGVVVEQEGDLDTALAYYQKAITNGGYYLAYENYAKILLKEQQYIEALTFLRQSRAVLPNNENLAVMEQYALANIWIKR